MIALTKTRRDLSWSLTAAIEKSSLPTLIFSSIWIALDAGVRRTVGDPVERAPDMLC